MRLLRIGVILLLAMLIASPLAYGSDWPMFKFDSGGSGFNSGETRVNPPFQLTWIRPPEKAHNEQRTRPVIADGVVYVGCSWNVYDWSGYKKTDGKLEAVSLATGKALWVIRDMILTGAPAVSNGKVFFGTKNDEFYSVSASDGSVIWKTKVDGKPTSAITSGQFICFGTSTGRLYALRADTGEIVWVTVGKAGMSAPAEVDGTIFVGGSEFLAVDAATGQVKWSFNSGRGHSAPAVKKGLVFTSSNYYLYCLDAATGQVKWSQPTADPYGASSSPVISNDALYWGTVTAYDPQTGAKKWSFDSKNKFSGASVAVANGFVFVGSTRNSNSFFDTSDGKLFVLKEGTGELAWQYFAGVQYNDWYAIDPSPSVADGSVVLNLSTVRFCCFSMPKPDASLVIDASKQKINPYNLEDGFVDVLFDLEAAAVISVDVLDYKGQTARRLVDKKNFTPGAHAVRWYGLIDFPEMADPGLKAQFGDKGVLIAPDGDYQFLVSVEFEDGLTCDGSADIKVEAEV